MKLSATSFLLALSLLPAEALAQDHAEILSGQVVELEKFSECRRLKNNAANRVFIPMNTPEEWAVGAKAFLSKTPTKIRKGPCIDYALNAKVWGRVGPPGSVWPHVIDAGAAGVTTLSSVGAAVGGGTATQSGDKILYNPGTAFKDKGYGETTRVTVPWTGIDFEGVPESGTSQIDVVGVWEGTDDYIFSENDPALTTNWTFETLAGSATIENTPAISIVGHRDSSFDGDHVTYGIHDTHYVVSWVILIDNTVKTRSAYALGAAPGNPNGDSYSNTILDAQINAAKNFIDAIAAWNDELSAGLRVTSENNGSFLYLNSTDTSPIVNIFTINSDLQFVAGGPTETSTDVSALKTKLNGIKHNGTSWVNFNAALTEFDKVEAAAVVGTEDGTAADADFVNIIVLSPGPSDRTSFSTIFDKLDGTSSSQWGFEFFAFRSAGANDLIDAIDSTGVATPLTAVTSIQDRSMPHPIRILDYIFAFRNAANTAWEFVKDDSGVIEKFPMRLISQSPIYVHQGNMLRFSSRSSWVCRTFKCTWDEFSPSTVVDESRFKANDGESTRVLVEYRYGMRSGYKNHASRFAAIYNAGNSIYKAYNYYVHGSYRPTPP